MTDAVATTPKAYRPIEAAKVIGVSRAHIYTLLQSGELRGRKLGRTTVILADDLDAYLEGLPEWVPEDER